MILEPLQEWQGWPEKLYLGTSHHFNWVCVGGSIKHPENGKQLDLSQDN
jgi:hypothetical protein